MDIPRGMVAVDSWLKRSAQPLYPALMQFRAKVAERGARDCSGCIFKGQSSKVCKLAGSLAVRVGMPDCDDKDAETGRTHIYVIAPTDPRQLKITED